MKFKNFITTNSIIVMLTLLSNSLCVFASESLENKRYEILEGNNIFIDNIIKDDIVDIELEGRALANILPEENSIYTENQPFNVNYLKLDTMKSNTKYTFVFYVVKNTLTWSNDGCFRFGNTLYDDTTVFSTAKTIKFSDIPKSGGFFVLKNTTKEHLSDNVISRTYLDNFESGEIKLKLMILEGDYNIDDLPTSYFSGIKGVDNTFNLESVSGSISSTNTHDFDLEGNWKKHDLKRPIYKNEIVKISVNRSGTNFRGLGLRLKNTTTNQVKYISFGSSGKSVYTFRNIYGFVIDEIYTYRDSSYNDLKVDEISINLTNDISDTSYQEYLLFENKKKHIDIKNYLNSLPDGTRDKVIKKNNGWYIERRIKKITLGKDFFADGLILDKYQTDNTIAFSLVTEDRAVDASKHTNNSILSDSFPIQKYADIIYSDSLEGFFADSTYKNFYCRLNKSRLDGYTLDIEGINAYLKNNNITILYKLETPIYEPLNIDLSLPIYEGTTYISNDSIIPATMKVKVDRIANKSSEAVEEAIDNPTLYNISIARMWVNQMSESLLKDEMQTKLNEIHNISDIQLDRKNTTSNLDVYIKSENMLSLSLNTNSITFEDFSGIENLELNSAVNLTINSSLPYELNAYLATEIQNSDKSKTMDKSILNIKESSESNYRAFNNINEKLTLKDNNIAGNDIIHNIDLLLRGGIAHEKDVYKTTIKFEAKQK